MATYTRSSRDRMDPVPEPSGSAFAAHDTPPGRQEERAGGSVDLERLIELLATDSSTEETLADAAALKAAIGLAHRRVSVDSGELRSAS